VKEGIVGCAECVGLTADTTPVWSSSKSVTPVIFEDDKRVPLVFVADFSGDIPWVIEDFTKDGGSVRCKKHKDPFNPPKGAWAIFQKRYSKGFSLVPNVGGGRDDEAH